MRDVKTHFDELRARVAEEAHRFLVGIGGWTSDDPNARRYEVAATVVDASRCWSPTDDPQRVRENAMWAVARWREWDSAAPNVNEVCRECGTCCRPARVQRVCESCGASCSVTADVASAPWVLCSVCAQTDQGYPPTQPIRALVVTRHSALVEYLREEGVIDETAEVITHASPEQVRGRHVIGVLPHHLSCEALSVTEVPLDLPAEIRGQELSVEQVRQYAGEPQTYVVIRCARPLDAAAVDAVYRGDH